MTPRIHRFAALGAAFGTLGACSSGNDPADSGAVGGIAAGQASLTVKLMDAPVDDVEEVNVEITAMWLKAPGGPAFELPLEDGPVTVDLLELTDTNAAILVDGETIDAGEYEWLAMDVNADIDTVFDSYVVTDTGQWKEIRVPSGRVRLVGGFEVEGGSAVQLLFDWDMRKGLVYPPGQGGYLLKPAFRIIDLAEYGELSGEVAVTTVTLPANECDVDTDPVDIDVGNVAYVYSGHDAVPDDIDTLDPEPFTTVELELNAASTHYTYRTLLPFGSYTVAFTCQAANDDSETDDTGNADPTKNIVEFFTTATDVTLNATTPKATVNF